MLIAAALKSAIIGKAQTSASYVLDTLELAQNTGAWYLEALALFVLVAVATVSNQERSAMELHGALQDVLPMLRTRLPASVVAGYDARIARLERELGQSEFERQIAQGRGLKWTLPSRRRGHRLVRRLHDPRWCRRLRGRHDRVLHRHCRRLTTAEPS